jgi:3-carboxy-cis,cis-muconate cycloisomerase
MSVRLFDSLATTEPLAAVFADAALLAAMARFETALAQAEAKAGVIPAEAAAAITRVAGSTSFDAAAIAGAARASGTITIPFVDMLTARVRAEDPGAATFVHWGATSQDVSDTALVLCLVAAERILEADHARVAEALRRIADKHAATVMLARTLLQPAAPTTFGLKAAGWLAESTRGYARISYAFRDACVVQFGGASGTLAALGPHGPEVASALAEALNVPLPDAPWHAHRDRLAALVTACGIYTGTLGKIARDLSLLMQDEVGEAFEPGGGSSSMPHKRNPAACAIVLAAANRLPALVSAFLAGMVQEHERGLGGWHAEAATIVAAVQATGSAVAALAGAIEGLQVDPERMLANIAGTRGVIFAERAMVLLAPSVGREHAGKIIASALADAGKDGGTFAELLAQDPEARAAIEPVALSSLDDPDAYLGSAEHFRRRLISGLGTNKNR